MVSPIVPPSMFEFFASLTALDTGRTLASPSGESLDDEVWGCDQNGLALEIERDIDDSRPSSWSAPSVQTLSGPGRLAALAVFRSPYHPWGPAHARLQ